MIRSIQKIIEQLKHHFALARLEHKEDTIVEKDGYTVVQRTGTHQEDDSPICMPSTLFELKGGNKVIAKSLCSYENSEMESAGPMIELFETAKEWQGNGFGSMLLDAIETHYGRIFRSITESSPVMFHVCYNTSFAASQWFQFRGGFEDLDGMGEELGKYLE